MPSAKSNSLSALKKWLTASTSRMKTVVSSSGTAGYRAAPAQSGNNDAKIGSRLDYGERFEKDGKTFQRLNWQLNKDAENSTLKKLAQQDSHYTWSTADVEVVNNPTKDEVKTKAEDIFEQLERNMDQE
jgi:SRSO17 transposase